MDGYQPWGVSFSIQTLDKYKANKLHNISIAPKCPLHYQPTNYESMDDVYDVSHLLACMVNTLLTQTPSNCRGLKQPRLVSGSVLQTKTPKTGSRKHLLNFWLACAPVSGTRFPMALARCLTKNRYDSPDFKGLWHVSRHGQRGPAKTHMWHETDSTGPSMNNALWPWWWWWWWRL